MFFGCSVPPFPNSENMGQNQRGQCLNKKEERSMPFKRVWQNRFMICVYALGLFAFDLKAGTHNVSAGWSPRRTWTALPATAVRPGPASAALLFPPAATAWVGAGRRCSPGGDASRGSRASACGFPTTRPDDGRAIPLVVQWGGGAGLVGIVLLNLGCKWFFLWRF